MVSNVSVETDKFTFTYDGPLGTKVADIAKEGLTLYGNSSGTVSSVIACGASGTTTHTLPIVSGALALEPTETNEDLTFTGPWDSDKTKTIYYQIVGKVIHLTLPNVSSAPNAVATDTITSTAMASIYRPSQNEFYPVVLLSDGTEEPGYVKINTSGIITFKLFTGANFSTTGNNGMRRTTIHIRKD